MKFIKKRIFDILHVVPVETFDGVFKVRVCAITDPDKFRICRLENGKPVKIEVQVKGNTYEVAERLESIAFAQEVLPDVIARVKDAHDRKNDVSIWDDFYIEDYVPENVF